jgi:hypothetical protein
MFGPETVATRTLKSRGYKEKELALLSTKARDVLAKAGTWTFAYFADDDRVTLPLVGDVTEVSDYSCEEAAKLWIIIKHFSELTSEEKKSLPDVCAVTYGYVVRTPKAAAGLTKYQYNSQCPLQVTSYSPDELFDKYTVKELEHPVFREMCMHNLHCMKINQQINDENEKMKLRLKETKTESKVNEMRRELMRCFNDKEIYSCSGCHSYFATERGCKKHHSICLEYSKIDRDTFDGHEKPIEESGIDALKQMSDEQIKSFFKVTYIFRKKRNQSDNQ